MTRTYRAGRAVTIARTAGSDRTAGLWLIAAAVLLLGGAALADNTPYAGQEAREISSLSAQDIDDLLAGRGWGFAKPAELNGYPGPAHILELADELDLDAGQRAAVQEIFDRMNARARALGADYVAAEAALDAAFEEGRITPETLAALTAEAARVEAELRGTHLAAHLEAAPVLTRHQTMLYNRARGYDGAASGHSGHGNH